VKKEAMVLPSGLALPRVDVERAVDDEEVEGMAGRADVRGTLTAVVDVDGAGGSCGVPVAKKLLMAV